MPGPLDRVVSLQEIADAAECLGLATRFVELDPADPQLRPLPLIAGLHDVDPRSEHHFVVLYGRRADHVQMLDYPKPALSLPVEMLAEKWDGRGLYLAQDKQALCQVAGNRQWLYTAVMCGGLLVFMVALWAWAMRRRASVPVPTGESL